MSDEMWRRREREQRDPAEDFGGPLFPDADPAAATDRPDDTGERRLSFGPNDTGPLPHWTDPPTGEIPRMEPAASSGDDTSAIRSASGACTTLASSMPTPSNEPLV